MHTPKIWLALGAWLLAAALFVFAFSILPVENSGFAIDWKVFWQATHVFQVDYSSQLVFTPPWGLVLLWPISWLPLGAGWGLLAFATLCTLAAAAASVQPRRLLAVLLLCTAYPTIRQLADGNIELLVIGGALLLLWALPRQHSGAFALGVFMCSAKFQGSWLLLLTAGLCAWRNWPQRQFWRMVVLVSVPVIGLLAWRGEAWQGALQLFPFAGTQIDASLQAVAGRLSLPVWVTLGLLLMVGLAVLAMLRRTGWQVGQAQAGGLLAAGLLLAPYAASNSVLSPLALAAPAVLAQRPWWGVLLFAAANFPYVMMGNLDWRLNSESNYWAFVLVLILFAALATSLQSAKSPTD